MILVLVEGRYGERVEAVRGVVIRQEAVRHSKIPFRPAITGFIPSCVSLTYSVHDFAGQSMKL